MWSTARRWKRAAAFAVAVFVVAHGSLEGDVNFSHQREGASDQVAAATDQSKDADVTAALAAMRGCTEIGSTTEKAACCKAIRNAWRDKQVLFTDLKELQTASGKTHTLQEALADAKFKWKTSEARQAVEHGTQNCIHAKVVVRDERQHTKGQLQTTNKPRAEANSINVETGSASELSAIPGVGRKAITTEPKQNLVTDKAAQTNGTLSEQSPSATETVAVGHRDWNEPNPRYYSLVESNRASYGDAMQASIGPNLPQSLGSKDSSALSNLQSARRGCDQTKRYSQGGCPSGFVSIIAGGSYFDGHNWGCGAGCAGGEYTNGGCACACQPAGCSKFVHGTQSCPPEDQCVGDQKLGMINSEPIYSNTPVCMLRGFHEPRAMPSNAGWQIGDCVTYQAACPTWEWGVWEVSIGTKCTKLCTAQTACTHVKGRISDTDSGLTAAPTAAPTISLEEECVKELTPDTSCAEEGGYGWQRAVHGANGGIICDQNGAITQINLRNTGRTLSGTIPECISKLQSLQILDLRDTALSGTIPEGISKLQSLQTLVLAHNMLSGTIPMGIGKLRNLLTLQWDYNKLSGTIPEGFCELIQLTWHNFGDNQLSGTIPKCISKMRSLLDLGLGKNMLSGTIPEGISEMQSLESLYVYKNKLSGTIPEGISRLERLEILVSADNMLSGTIPMGITKLQKLKRLWLQNNKLSGTIPDEISRLTRLEALYLQNNKLSGTIPDEISRLTRLEALSLSNNVLFGELKMALPQGLIALNLAWNRFTGEPPVHWLELESLQFMNLAGNQFDFNSNMVTHMNHLTEEQTLCWVGAPQVCQRLGGLQVDGMCICYGNQDVPTAHGDNLVSYQSNFYRTLDHHGPLDPQQDGCQSSLHPVHDGWFLAPDNEDSRKVIAFFPWGTRCLILASGHSYNTKVTAIMNSTWNTTNGTQNTSTAAHCPLFPSNPSANNGICGPGSSCDEGVPHLTSLMSTTLFPIAYRVSHCSRRILVYKPNAYQLDLPSLQGVWLGHFQCQQHGSAIVQNVTIEMQSPNYPEQNTVVHVTGLKDTKCCLGSATSLTTYDSNTQQFIIRTAKWTENNCNYGDLAINGSVHQLGSVFYASLNSSSLHCSRSSLINQMQSPLNASNLPQDYTVPNAGPILNQGFCGSCYAFASAGALSDRINLIDPSMLTNGSTRLTISPMYVSEHTINFVEMGFHTNNIGFVHNTPNYGGCNGGFPWSVFDFLSTYGAATCDAEACKEGCVPYDWVALKEMAPDNEDGGCLSWYGCGSERGNQINPNSFDWRRTKHGHHHRARRHQKHYCRSNRCGEKGPTIQRCIHAAKNSANCISGWWNNQTEVLIRDEIFKNGPVTATMKVFQDFYDYGNTSLDSWQNSSVYDGTECLSNAAHHGYHMGMHAVKITGWGETTDGTKYWLVANSWGKTWNGDGYFKIIRGSNLCGIEMNVCYASPSHSAVDSKLHTGLRQAAIKKILKKSKDQAPGAWIPHSRDSAPLQEALAAHIHHMQRHDRRGRSLSNDPKDYNVITAHSQVVAGTNFRFSANTLDSNGDPQTVHAIVHKSLSGTHSTLATRVEPQHARLVSAAHQLVIIKDVPATVPSAAKFNVSVQLVDKAGQPITARLACYLSLLGKGTLIGNLTSEFNQGVANFRDLSSSAGKFNLFFSTEKDSSTGFHVVSSTMRATVAPAFFLHTVTGMTEELWGTDGVQDAFKSTVSSAMGMSVEEDDIKITHQMHVLRRTPGTALRYEVALTNLDEARPAVAALEHHVAVGKFDTSFKSHAMQNGVVLPEPVTSSLEGTSSSDLPVPKAPVDDQRPWFHQWWIVFLAGVMCASVAFGLAVAILLIVRKSAASAESSGEVSEFTNPVRTTSASVTAIPIDTLGNSAPDVELDSKKGDPKPVVEDVHNGATVSI